MSDADGPNGESAWLRAAVALLLVASALPYTNLASPTVAYALVFAAYVLFGTMAVAHAHSAELTAPKWALAALCVVWSVYLGHLLADVAGGTVTVGAVVRIPAFVFLTGVNLFFLPRTLPRGAFLGVLARVAAAFVLLGLPTLFVDAYAISVIEITRWRSVATIPLIGGSRNVVTSVFANPNVLTYLAMVGVISACGELVETKGSVAGALVVINGIGVLAANGRASIAGTLVGVGLMLVHRRVSRRAFQTLFVVGAATAAALALMTLHLIPGPNIVQTVEFRGRREIWAGVVQAVAKQPLFGYGAGDTGRLLARFVVEPYSGKAPHSSYMRVFFETGVVGGVTFLGFVGKVILDRLSAGVTDDEVVLLALMSAICVTMAFEGFTIFGASLMSVVAATVFGYALRGTGRTAP